MLTEIRLYGHLRARFGRTYHLSVHNAAEAVRALCAVVPGFRAYLVKRSEPGYRVWLGNDVLQDTEQLGHPPGRLIRFVPVTAGSGGIGKVIVGAALIGFAVYTGGASLTLAGLPGLAMNIGISLVLGGLSELLASNPKVETSGERPTNLPSFAFNGVVNTVAQGNAISVLYGRRLVGSQVASTGLSVVQIAIA